MDLFLKLEWIKCNLEDFFVHFAYTMTETQLGFTSKAGPRGFPGLRLTTSTGRAALQISQQQHQSKKIVCVHTLEWTPCPEGLKCGTSEFDSKQRSSSLAVVTRIVLTFLNRLRNFFIITPLCLRFLKPSLWSCFFPFCIIYLHLLFYPLGIYLLTCICALKR